MLCYPNFIEKQLEIFKTYKKTCSHLLRIYYLYINFIRIITLLPTNSLATLGVIAQKREPRNPFLSIQSHLRLVPSILPLNPDP